MNKAERNAIETNMNILCDEIESELFLPFLRIKQLVDKSECDLINGETTNRSKVLKTFDLIKPKKCGWEMTIAFLLELKYVNTVEKLKWSVANYSELQVVTTQVGLLSTESSDWRQFIRDVTDFYLGDYRVVESFDVDGDSDLIESVWVDLQLEGSREPIGHYGEIFAQMRAKNCRLAIVRGQPGSGKTTLAKKIAYDWAKERKTDVFDMILAVPLRNVQSKSDLLEMAVRFHHDKDSDSEAKQICEDLRREKLKILIILDGLDEFQIPSDSPLSSIFGSAVNNDVNIASTTCLIKFDFDLLVTSRPFACHLIHANIAAVKYEIVGFSEGKQVEFVTKRCKKAEGKIKAIEYLNQSNCLKEISQNPFLLTLICFLSDHNESIPSNLTKLYVTFVHRMFIRAARKKAVGNNFDPSNWQQSELLKNLGSLALLGAIKNQFQFNQDEMQMCHVTKEYFHSGLLQYHSDPIGLALKCDFPHRSIQDFLAAFYAVHYWGDKTLMEATGWPEDIWSGDFADLIPQMKVELLIAHVIRTDSQFVRFFFGLISAGNEFSDRFRLVLEEIIANFYFDPNWFLWVGCNIADCSDRENLAAGQIANDKAVLIADRHYLHPTQLEEKKIKFAYGEGRELRKDSVTSMISQLTENFRRGMKLSQIGDGSTSFSVETENPRRLKMLRLYLVDNSTDKIIGNCSMYNHIGHLYVRSRNLLEKENVAIQQILTQISFINNFTIFDLSLPPTVSLFVTVEAQHANSPKCFKLKYLHIMVNSGIGQKMMEKFQSPTHFQPKKITISSVKNWHLFNDFSLTMVVDNSLTNVDIWNEICPARLAS